MFIVDRDIIMLDFSVFSHCLFVSTSATDCLERLVSKMTCYVSSGMLNSTTTSAVVTEPIAPWLELQQETVIVIQAFGK